MSTGGLGKNETLTTKDKILSNFFTNVTATSIKKNIPKHFFLNLKLRETIKEILSSYSNKQALRNSVKDHTSPSEDA